MEPDGDDPIKLNNAKNIQMYFNKTICDELKHIVLEFMAKRAYDTLMAQKPDMDAKRQENPKEGK